MVNSAFHKNTYFICFVRIIPSFFSLFYRIHSSIYRGLLKKKRFLLVVKKSRSEETKDIELWNANKKNKKKKKKTKKQAPTILVSGHLFLCSAKWTPCVCFSFPLRCVYVVFSFIFFTFSLFFFGRFRIFKYACTRHQVHMIIKVACVCFIMNIFSFSEREASYDKSPIVCWLTD